MLRLRTLLVIGFSVVALIPVLILAVWVSDSAIKKEYSTVEEKHLLVAKNLTNALSRYANDVEEVFLLASRNIQQGELAPSPELEKLFSSLQFLHICRLGDQRNHMYFQKPGSDVQGPTEQQVDESLRIAEKGTVKFLPVMKNANDQPVITMVHTTDEGEVVVAELETSYFVELQQAITFGKLGHAAIVDQAGNVLAHPKAEWVVSAKNIAKIDPVAKMMAGQQGVSFFYSPAIKADMVAGFSSVPETGWGVMIPQPVSELHLHAAALIRIALSISVAGIAFALCVAWWLAGFVSRPTSEVASAARSIAEHKAQTSQVSKPSLATQELTDLVDSFNTMVGEVSCKTNELKHLAHHDSLTGLPNRTLLKELLEQQIANVKNQQDAFVLLFLDLDQFKEVNDTLGHGYGDKMLTEVAARLTNVVGDQGTVSRQGGDEFAIVLTPNQDKDAAELLSQHIMMAIHAPFHIDGQESFISTSIGIAHCPHDAHDIEGLFKCADLAMYAAKADDIFHYQRYTFELHRSLSDRKVLENELRRAIEREEFELFYQPRVEPKTGRIQGFEALVRWHHPYRGLVLPGSFIPVAERTGDIIKLGDWIIRQACKDHVKWRSLGLGDVSISVNLSGRQFHDPKLLDGIDMAFEDFDISPSLFEFEVTESLAMQKPIRAVETLQKLHDRGFNISIDDFGTGYSSLARLKHLPIDKIKIDKSFVQGVGHNTKDLAIVEHIFHLAQGLELGVVAEGVEEAAQLAFLTDLRCAEIQGFIYSKAVPSDQVVELLKRENLKPLST